MIKKILISITIVLYLVGVGLLFHHLSKKDTNTQPTTQQGCAKDAQT